MGNMASAHRTCKQRVDQQQPCNACIIHQALNTSMQPSPHNLLGPRQCYNAAASRAPNSTVHEAKQCLTASSDAAMSPVTAMNPASASWHVHRHQPRWAPCWVPSSTVHCPAANTSCSHIRPSNTHTHTHIYIYMDSNPSTMPHLHGHPASAAWWEAARHTWGVQAASTPPQHSPGQHLKPVALFRCCQVQLPQLSDPSLAFEGVAGACGLTLSAFFSFWGDAGAAICPLCTCMGSQAVNCTVVSCGCNSLTTPSHAGAH